MRPAREMATDAPLRRFSAEESCLTYKILRTAGCGGGFLSGLGCGGGFATTLGLWRSRGRFANQFGRHDARDEQLGGEAPEPFGGLSCQRLEAGNVLSLKALRALFHFKLHSLTFVEGLVSFHRDRGEVHENIFSRLALDESEAL